MSDVQAFADHYFSRSISPQELIDWGNDWYANVKNITVPGAADRIIQNMNACLEILNLKS